MFRAHTPIIRSIRCWVAAYGFLYRVCGWVVVLVAVDDAVHHPHRTHDLHSGSQDHHPPANSAQNTTCCNSTSNAPDDGRFYLLYLLACSNTLYLVILHAIYIEFTSVIFTLIIGCFYIVCMFVCIFFFLYLVISYLFPIIRLEVFQSLLIL